MNDYIILQYKGCTRIIMITFCIYFIEFVWITLDLINEPKVVQNKPYWDTGRGILM